MNGIAALFFLTAKTNIKLSRRQSAIFIPLLKFLMGWAKHQQTLKKRTS